MCVVRERLPLVVGQGPPERRRDLLEVPAAEEVPGQVARERGHRHAVSSRDDRRGLLERREVPGPAVAVGDEDVPEAGARQRGAVVDERVTHHALPHAHRPHGVEREGAEVERGGQQRGPVRPRGGEAFAERLGEVAGGDRIDAHRQVRSVLFERAHGQDHDGARAVERVERGARHLFEQVHGQNELPFVAAR
ncbi:MAG: hypothetical protein AUI57_04980 [Candidatus Rokubacteria bacterium 13_1_40CM_2_68_8]|nr:MAG: hypothetical protein AUI57_04980 [Candidatus Rokubacteria bacterium 13_1_40CM_2_68_8]